jgi:hypothetical protein
LNRKLKTIPRPKPDSVTLLLPKKGERLPLIKFDGDVNLLCGNCNEILVEGLIEDEEQIMNVVVHCPVCRSYNEINIHSVKSDTEKANEKKKHNSTLFY